MKLSISVLAFFAAAVQAMPMAAPTGDATVVKALYPTPGSGLIPIMAATNGSLTERDDGPAFIRFWDKAYGKGSNIAFPLYGQICRDFNMERHHEWNDRAISVTVPGLVGNYKCALYKDAKCKGRHVPMYMQEGLIYKLSFSGLNKQISAWKCWPYTPTQAQLDQGTDGHV